MIQEIPFSSALPDCPKCKARGLVCATAHYQNAYYGSPADTIAREGLLILCRCGYHIAYMACADA